MKAQDEIRHNGHGGSGQRRDPDSTSHRPLSRDILPTPDIPPAGLTTYDAKDPDSSFPPIEPIRPPEGAPNVLIVLIDDVGFGASSAFGGPCNTPNFERLAAGGLRYNRFHTTALCAPYDGEQAGEGRVEATHPLVFSADETTDVAYEAGTPVSAAHTRERFNGDVKWVRIELGSDMHDHGVDPEDAVRVAMSLQ